MPWWGIVGICFFVAIVLFVIAILIYLTFSTWLPNYKARQRDKLENKRIKERDENELDNLEKFRIIIYDPDINTAEHITYVKQVTKDITEFNKFKNAILEYATDRIAANLGIDLSTGEQNIKVETPIEDPKEESSIEETPKKDPKSKGRRGRPKKDKKN